MIKRQARSVWCFALLWFLFGQALHPQTQLISVGILCFQDESVDNVPAELCERLAKDFQQKLVLSYKDLLPRLTGLGMDASARNLPLEQLAALGKQNGVKFLIRGGILALTIETLGEEMKASAELYAELISTETATIINSTRAKGSGSEISPAPANVIQWESINIMSDDFRNSALGRALTDAVEQLAASTYQMIISPVLKPTDQPSAPAFQAQEVGQVSTAQTEEEKAAEMDEELQQLLAQAEAILAESSSASMVDLDSLRQTVEKLKEALNLKATLLEQGQDVSQVDQEISLYKQDLQNLITSFTEQASSESTVTSDSQQLSSEEKSLLTSINEFLDESSNIIQKIKEIRAALRSESEEQAAAEEAAPAEEPSEESTAEVSGVVTESGEPVEGATVIDPESGASATTDSSGFYTLERIPGGRLARLVVVKGGKQLAAGKIDLLRGRATVADWEVKGSSITGFKPALTILPSSVRGASSREIQGTLGTVRGVILDDQGKPLARALVNLQGFGAARTDSSGKYVFFNVPAGTYTLTIQKGGLNLKSEQILVTAKKTIETRILFSAEDKISKEPVIQKMIATGAGTILQGVILDEKNKPIGGAKITVIHSSGALSVFTDIRGNYIFKDLKSGSYRLLVSKVGFEEASQNINLQAAQTKKCNFKLKKSSPYIQKILEKHRATQAKETSQPPSPKTKVLFSGLKKGQLTGSVIDAQTKKPIADATVYIKGVQSARTDQQGIYRIASVSPGNYSVMANHKNYEQVEKTVTIQPDRSCRLDFILKSKAQRGFGVIKKPAVFVPQYGQLRGQITDSKTGKPISNAIVSIPGQPDAFTDQAGNYFFRNLNAGSYQVKVRKNGYLEKSTSVTVQAGKTAVTNFKLTPVLIRKF